PGLNYTFVFVSLILFPRSARFWSVCSDWIKNTAWAADNEEWRGVIAPGCCAAARGTTTTITAAPPIGTGTRPRTATITTVCVSVSACTAAAAWPAARNCGVHGCHRCGDRQS